MKLWRLYQTHKEGNSDPWKHWHNGCFDEFVVFANTEEEARQLAHENGGLENYKIPGVSPWLDSEYTSCEWIKRKKGVVSFHDLTQ